MPVVPRVWLGNSLQAALTVARSVLDTKREKTYIALKSRIFGKGCLYKEGDKSVEILEEMTGTDLKGKHYKPLFPYFQHMTSAFVVMVDTYVTDDSGTGIVHNAPGHGEDDYRICMANGIVTAENVVCPIDDRCEGGEQGWRGAGGLGTWHVCLYCIADGLLQRSFYQRGAGL